MYFLFLLLFFYSVWFSLIGWFGLIESNPVCICLHVANEWLFLSISINLRTFVGFISPLGYILSAYLDSVSLKSIYSLTKLHLTPFILNLSLPSFPNIFSKIWSQVLNWRPMSQIHSANIFLLQWLFWVAVFVFLFIIHFNWITSHLKLRKFHIVTWLLLKKYTICHCGIHILQDGNLLDVNDRSFSHGKQASIYHKCQQVLFFLSWLTLFIYYLPGPRSHFRI